MNMMNIVHLMCNKQIIFLSSQVHIQVEVPLHRVHIEGICPSPFHFDGSVTRPVNRTIPVKLSLIAKRNGLSQVNF